MATIPVQAPFTLKNILFATDFSEFSDAALPYAFTLTRRYGATLTFLHVLPAHPTMIPLDAYPAVADDVREQAEREMARYLKAGTLRGVPHVTLLRSGDLAESVADAVLQRHADLLVLGTRGRGGLRKLLLGSASEQIFRLARCPVLTVGPNAPHNQMVDAELRRILFPTDFSAGSLHALPHAISLARENKAQLILLHLLHFARPYSTDFPERYAAAARTRLGELISGDNGLRQPVELMVEFAPPAEGILRVSEEEQIDLIVMGVRPATSLRTSAHLPWSTAHGVVCAASCPVLTVRA